MKDILKNTNKTEWIITGIYKIAIYVCWFLFACLFNVYLRDKITDTKLICLVIALIIIYGIRTFLKNLYRKNAYNSYYNIKHSIELYYFKKLGNLSYKRVEEIDKLTLADAILEVAYNYTKIISDIFEYIIPALIGLLILFIKLLDLNKIFGVIAFIILIIILARSYKNINDEELDSTNYNDLLKEFILKMTIIKKLNIFTFCLKKLDTTKENDICILKNNDTINDIKFTNSIYVLISVILISSFIFIHNTTTRLGVIIFFIIIILKLQDLLYKINPAIKNMFRAIQNKNALDKIFNEEVHDKVNTKWERISIKNGLINYKDTTVDIKIPSFELIRKDHVSIMGASKEGKSTILNVLSGIFKLDEGDILFDGASTKEVVLAYYSSTSDSTFGMSLRENLAFEKKIKDEDILNLIDEINLSSWYKNLKNGLDEILGNDISPDVLEKLNIIRAIISDADVYFFDEPTSSLDSSSEKKVAAMFKKYFKDKTYILVSKKTVLTNLCKKHYFIKNHTLLENEPLL